MQELQSKSLGLDNHIQSLLIKELFQTLQKYSKFKVANYLTKQHNTTSLSLII
ncbi:hypothetical protein VCHE45_3895 [Vibrio cholerae HE-45]|nr:hypothetical protein VCHE45_3895 [Vibrio cholerae HE-45]